MANTHVILKSIRKRLEGLSVGKKVVPHDSKSDLPLAILLEHMHKKLEINWTKIKGGC